MKPYAKIGDTILVTCKSLGLYGKEFVVTQSLPWEVFVSRFPGSDNTWCFLHSSYKIVNNGDKSSCPDCNGTGKIQLFTSTIKCSCVG